MKIHKGDTVKIISGKDGGKTGKVMKVYPQANAVLLEGLNLFKKHRKPKREGEKGEMVSVPRPLSASKVMLVCSSCGKAARVGHRSESDSPTKVRYCKKCGNQT